MDKALFYTYIFMYIYTKLLNTHYAVPIDSRKENNWEQKEMYWIRKLSLNIVQLIQ